MVNVVVFILCVQIFAVNSVRDKTHQSNYEGATERGTVEPSVTSTTGTTERGTVEPSVTSTTDQIWYPGQLPGRKFPKFVSRAQAIRIADRGTVEQRVILTTGTTERGTVEPSVTLATDKIWYPGQLPGRKFPKFVSRAQAIRTTEQGTVEPSVTLATDQIWYPDQLPGRKFPKFVSQAQANRTTERGTVEPSVTLTEFVEPTMPKECTNQSYCNVKDENYPEKKMEELINEYNLSNFAIREEIPEKEEQLLKERILFGQDVKAVNVYNICLETIKTEKLYLAVNVDKKNKYIVQGKNFQQNLITRSCDKSPLERSSKKVKFTPNVEGKCTQLQAKLTLLTMSGEGTIEPDKFSMPCCCICKWNFKTKSSTIKED